MGRHTRLLASLVVSLCACGDDDDPDGRADMGAMDAGPAGASTCVDSVAVGSTFVCALRSDGQVWCWGDNEQGQLGDAAAGESRPAPGPVRLDGAPLTGVVEVGAGSSHACARLDDGRVVCWGDNSSGQRGDAGGPSAAAVTSGGSVIDDAVGLSVGVSQVCVIRPGGVIECAGLNNSGQLGDGTDLERSGFITVQRDEGGPLGDVTAAQEGSFHGCALATSGVWCWGRADNGQLGNGATPLAPLAAVPAALPDLASDGVVDLFVGFQSTCVVRASGGTWCWGEIENFALDELIVFVDETQPTELPDLPPAVAVASGIGGDHLCVVTSAGELSCFGRNNVGQLGTGTTDGRRAPAPMELESGGTLGGVVSAAASQTVTCAVTMTGGLYCAGTNSSGQLARAEDEGSIRAVAIPVPCPG